MDYEHGIGIYDQNGDKPEYLTRIFTAPASGAWGGSITIAALAVPVAGMERGPLASRVALDAMEDYFKASTTSNIAESIQAALRRAHEMIADLQSTDPQLGDMGTSVTVAVIAADRLFVSRVGDGRVYLIRDELIRPIVGNLSWVQQARENWDVAPGDLQEYAASGIPEDYVGREGQITPETAPVEFLWPGDSLLVCSGELAEALREDEMHSVLVTRPAGDAADRLVQAAVDRGARDDLIAMVVDVTGQAAAAPIPLKGRRRLSTAAQGLIVGNILLFMIILLLLARGGRMSAFFQPTPPIEVAKPMFVPTLAPEPDTGASDPFAVTPAAPPAAAPSATPLPTFTPNPQTAGWKPPATLVPQVPANGFMFGGPDAAVILAWNSAGDLPEDVFYVVTIRKYVAAKLVGESHNWTKSNRIRLDASFYTAFKENGKFGMAAPTQPVAEFQWFVTLYRLSLIKPDGSLDGVPISRPSQTMRFLWGPAQPTPTVYGQQGLETDPFFSDQQHREASVAGMLSPVSLGMAGLSIALTLAAGWSRVKRRLRRGIHSGTHS